MSEEEIKAGTVFPDGVEKIIISKNDYDRLCSELIVENLKLKQEIERLNKEIEEK